ncbi:MAG: HAD-IA family hydrolase [Fimbriimonadales bacterium]|nr:HAD-IA family hydrolase [Fimbriimonadales bacterium]
MKRVITFDAAGTLIDHSWDPAGLAIEAAQHAGLNLPAESAREKYEAILARSAAERAEVELRGDPSEIRTHWRRGLSEWLTELGEDPIHSRKIHEYSERAVFNPNGTMWRLYPDVIPALDMASDAGVSIGVISNWDRSLHIVLSNLGIADRFDFVIASLEFGHEKPSVEIFREAERRACADSTHCSHIGDDFGDDVMGAQGAGWRSVHLRRDDGPIRTLTEAVAEALR